MTKEERQTAIKQIVGECKGKEGATDADEAEVLARKDPTTKGGKCIHACIGETLGLMQGGKLNGDGMIDSVQKAFNGEEKAMNVIKQIVADCTSITDPDRCEMAAKGYICSKGVMVKMGIDPETLM